MRTLLLFVAAFSVGCSGKIDDPDASVDAATAEASTSDSPAASALSGTWVGYVESFKFGDGSGAVTLVLDGSGAGTTFFGPGPALAPPTDPEIGYPPEADARENFAFTNLSPTFAAPRLTVSVAPGEVHKTWCELQTTVYPMYNSESDGGCGPLLGYGCLPNAATQGNGSSCAWSSCDHPNWTTIDCGKLALCSMGGGACQCAQTSCTVNLPPSGSIAFDVQLAGNSLDGSVTGLDGSVHNVHFTRQ